MCFFFLVTSAFNAVWTLAALKEQNKIMLWYDQEIRKPDWTVWQSACRVYTGAGNAFEPLLPQTGNYKIPQTFPASFQISAYLTANATNSVYIYNNPIPVNTGRLWDHPCGVFFFAVFPFFSVFNRLIWCLCVSFCYFNSCTPVQVWFSTTNSKSTDTVLQKHLRLTPS